MSGAASSQSELHNLPDGRQRLNLCERSLRQSCGNADERDSFRLTVGISDLHPRNVDIFAAKNATECADDSRPVIVAREEHMSLRHCLDIVLIDADETRQPLPGPRCRDAPTARRPALPPRSWSAWRLSRALRPGQCNRESHRIGSRAEQFLAAA